ncbi:addiction module toxin, RelE/StbE family [Paenimyroides ummariense]|uniref:Addiction module toxin, RelE/StbE family n=1 Tax=Paenimyroides ummariense TaxID=913024 RepID=A0A1I5FST1_9FLAO|nr:type II toxin-antitoxin system RelE/ParE family toxin [Paenimyroides ummariense]SFO26874.1 addiction module toxin, RelE/StbE family [Paenimyroides ummariense]
MVEKTYKIIWTNEAKNDLKDIFDFIKKQSVQSAKNVISDIRNAPKSVHFLHQNEKEYYNNKYRRIIIRNYKVLYRINEFNNELIVAAVFHTNQEPEKLSEID